MSHPKPRQHQFCTLTPKPTSKPFDPDFNAQTVSLDPVNWANDPAGVSEEERHIWSAPASVNTLLRFVCSQPEKAKSTNLDAKLSTFEPMVRPNQF